MKTKFTRFVTDHGTRVVMPIGVYAGLELTGANVIDAVTKPEAQISAQAAIHDRYNTPVWLTAMDLSAEAEAFGCEVRMSEDEIPTVMGRLVTTLDQVHDLKVPVPWEKRTRVHLDSARGMVARSGGAPVLGGLIGPVSLAGRLFGVSEFLELTITEPETAMLLLEKAASFLASYAQAFRESGAWGVIMAEPVAGLLSPRSLARFSAPFVRRIIEETRNENFTLLLHNCGAKLVHLASVLESNAEIFHFGAPMDLPAALLQVPEDIVLAGNLDPSAVFLNGSPDDIRTKVRELQGAAKGRRNFILSSGCDLAPGTPLANLDAFFDEAAS